MWFQLRYFVSEIVSRGRSDRSVIHEWFGESVGRTAKGGEGRGRGRPTGPSMLVGVQGNECNSTSCLLDQLVSVT